MTRMKFGRTQLIAACSHYSTHCGNGTSAQSVRPTSSAKFTAVMEQTPEHTLSRRKADMTKLQTLLESMNACRYAREWIGDRTLAKAWNECPRADWLLWFAARRGVDKKKIVLAACACARLALKFVRAGEDRPRLAIE